MSNGDSPDPDRTFSAASKLDNLSDLQKHEVENQSRPNAALIHETIRAEGVSELERGAMSLALSALAAGLSIGFSLIVQGEIYARATPAVRDLVSPLGYTVGFLIVVLGRQQLFTENTLTPVLPLLHNRDIHTFWQVARLWAVVLAGNVAGAVIFAFAVAHSHAFAPEILRAFSVLGHETIQGNFGATVARGIYAGWLIALMVWLLPAAGGSRPHLIIIITYIVAMAHFSHIIAGSVDCAYIVVTGEASWADFALKFFTPTLIGNVIGGVALVAALNFGQVAPEVEGDE